MFQLSLLKGKMDASVLVVSSGSQYRLITARYLVVCAWKHKNDKCRKTPSIQFLLVSACPRSGRGGSRVTRVYHAFQLLLGGGYVIPPVSLGPNPGPFPDGCAWSTSNGRASQRHPYKTPEPPQPAPFSTARSSRSTPDVGAPRSMSSHSPGEPHFGCLHQWGSQSGFAEVPPTFQAETLMCEGRLVSRDVRVIAESNINSHDLGGLPVTVSSVQTLGLASVFTL